MPHSGTRFIVVTTIFEPSPAIRAFAETAGWRLIVVGDRKTPKGWSLPNAVYLGPDDQRDLFGDLADAVPWNHYARKNLGYLYAVREGASVILETDDDNGPLPGWEGRILPNEADLEAIASPRMVNIYRLFTDAPVWPRGLPLDLVLDNSGIELQASGMQRVSIASYLVDGEPDVDAVYRMVVNLPPCFRQRPPVVLDEGVFAPFNSQSTLWYPEAYPFLYLPAFVTFRFTDILRGWIAQRAVWGVDGRLAFASPILRQDRNAHNLMRDFESEIPCYLQSAAVVDALARMTLPVGPFDAMRAIYDTLHAMDVVTREEVSLAGRWLSAAQR